MNYRVQAKAMARKYGIPVNLFESMIAHESGWDPKATSGVGAIGLTQLMPRTAMGLHVNPHDPLQNLEGGARYLHNAYGHFGNWKDALRAYNQGWGGAAADPTNGLHYATSIMDSAGTLKAAKAPALNPMSPAKGLGITLSHGSSLVELASMLFPHDPSFVKAFKATVLPEWKDPPPGQAGSAAKDWELSPALPAAAVGPHADAVAYASTQLGKPYVFGSGPDASSFDCSDLIQWAYKQIGINLPRTTFEQIHIGTRVSLSHLRPGDLIFPSTHHVVLYVGHGKVIAAPHTGTVVQYQNLSDFGTPIMIRRVT